TSSAARAAFQTPLGDRGNSGESISFGDISCRATVGGGGMKTPSSASASCAVMTRGSQRRSPEGWQRKLQLPPSQPHPESPGRRQQRSRPLQSVSDKSWPAFSADPFHKIVNLLVQVFVRAIVVDNNVGILGSEGSLACVTRRAIIRQGRIHIDKVALVNLDPFLLVLESNIRHHNICRHISGVVLPGLVTVLNNSPRKMLHPNVLPKNLAASLGTQPLEESPHLRVLLGVIPAIPVHKVSDAHTVSILQGVQRQQHLLQRVRKGVDLEGVLRKQVFGHGGLSCARLATNSDKHFSVLSLSCMTFARTLSVHA